MDGPHGETHRILGTVYADGMPRVLRIDNYSMDMVPEGNMVIIQNQDMPGVIGTVGTSFGDAPLLPYVPASCTSIPSQCPGWC